MLKSTRIVLILGSFFLFSLTSFAQTTHLVIVGGTSNTFSPSDLTVNVGDTVKWANKGGFHNVVADDASFTSGDPSAEPWVYDHVFLAEGDNPYHCVVHGGSGGVGMSGVVHVMNVTNVDDNGITAGKYELNQNYPNPFNPGTQINFSIPTTGSVLLAVYNSLGNEVTTLVNGVKATGNYSVYFDATNLASGIYYYKLVSGEFSSTKKMLLLK